jgi:hypothetical protein
MPPSDDVGGRIWVRSAKVSYTAVGWGIVITLPGKRWGILFTLTPFPLGNLVYPEAKIVGNTLYPRHQIVQNLMKDKDLHVQKGYGWMLKASSIYHQKEVYDFVIQNRTKMARTALRYSMKKCQKG